MARIAILSAAALGLAACHSTPTPEPLEPAQAEACGLYAEVLRARFGAETRGVKVNRLARPGAAPFLRWPDAPGLDARVQAELSAPAGGAELIAPVRCDWPALGLPAGRTTSTARGGGVHLTLPSYSADGGWALVTVWEAAEGTTCLFRRDGTGWSKVGCEAAHMVVV